MAANSYKKLTKEQKEYIAKPIDHNQLCSDIRKKHGATILHVRGKYQGEAKPVWIDKGTASG